MQLVFDKAGKYMNDFKVMEVTPDHVKVETIFKVDEANGTDYVRVKKAHVFKEPEKADETDIDKMTVAELEKFAVDQIPVIELGDAKNKAEKLDVIKAEIVARKSDD